MLVNEKDLEVLSIYLQFCSEEGNTLRTLDRKRDTIKRFLSAYALLAVNPSVIHEYLLSFEGKSAYYQKREIDEVKNF